jgi:hypothetical protein
MMVMWQAFYAKVPKGILDSSYFGDHIMEANQQDQIFPDWSSNSGIEFWEPDDLYMEWLIFLYGIWDKVEYL